MTNLDFRAIPQGPVTELQPLTPQAVDFAEEVLQSQLIPTKQLNRVLTLIEHNHMEVSIS